ncbi:MAG: SUMF1/EgtB/PvdO family nonheme iron enzyme [bacterium]
MKLHYTIIKILTVLTILFMPYSCDDTTEPKKNNNNGDGNVPVITTVTQNPTFAGYPITITGNYLGFSSDDGYVEINGKKAVKYVYWSYNTIIAFLPDDATSGKLVVVYGGLTSNEVDVTISSASTGNAPVINDFDQEKPSVRNMVGIEGSNFGEGQNGNYVIFNGVIASKYISWKDKKIVVDVPTGATSGDVYVYVNGQKSNVKYLEIQQEISVLDLVLVSGGKFIMGANDELSGFSYPKHEVIITKPFYISKYEITQKAWETASTVDHNSYNLGDNNPVERVSWLNACKFCNSLSVRERFEQVYTITGEEVSVNWDANGYRLPTEAEWELAAKAGIDYKYGKGQDGKNGVVNNLAWHNENSGNSTHQVGQKQPNGFGIYDMLGNVNEWCWNWSDGESYADTNNKIDPKGPETGDIAKVLRGGSYIEDKSKTTCTYRWSEQHTRESEYYIGFRVTRNAR